MIGMPLVLALITSPIEPDIVSIYHSSPLETRRILRQDMAQNRPTAERVARIVKATGDHSFDSLANPREALRKVIRLQQRGLAKWQQEDYLAATSHYLKALKICRASGVADEERFCLYYLAEISVEQSLYQQALEHLKQAFEGFDQTRSPFLAALLNESRGYALWFLDYLPDSIASFVQAMQHWERVGFDSGIVSSWNNLACLYEQLRLLKKADRCYRQAVAATTSMILPEISFQLLRNYALFQKRQGNEESALAFLNRCREFRAISPEEFQLAEAEILEEQALLHSIQSKDPVIRIERHLLLSEQYLRAGKYRESRNHAQQAITLSNAQGLNLYSRRGALLFGDTLERDGHWEEASEVYAESFFNEQILLRVGIIFPYTRSISPLLDGWIRCQIRLGRSELARAAIHLQTQLRRQKAKLLLDNLPRFSTYSNLFERFAAVIGAENHSLNRYPSALKERFTQLRSFTLIELWPCENEVFVWIDGSGQSQFRALPFSGETRALMDELVDSYHASRLSLPSHPPWQALKTFYSEILEPLEESITTRQLLIIPHKELQSFPFELATWGKGKGISKEYILSYLPSLSQLFEETPEVPENPILFLPETFSLRAGAQTEELNLKEWFPELRVVRKLDPASPLVANWIHVSTHFNLDTQIWPFSAWENNGDRLSILDFLKGQLHCRLLSIGACDVANNHSSNSPYWLGLTELLQTGRAQSLVLSRWQLDEAASKIFVDFYRFCRSGISMDRALHMAHLEFQQSHIRRSGVSAPGAHPYFWAGVIYVGKPGKKLYPGSDQKKPSVFLFLLGALMLGALLHKLARNRR